MTVGPMSVLLILTVTTLVITWLDIAFGLAPIAISILIALVITVFAVPLIDWIRTKPRQLRNRFHF